LHYDVLVGVVEDMQAIEDLRKQTGISSQPEFNQLHVYFREQPNYVELMIKDVLAERELWPRFLSSPYSNTKGE